MKAGIIGFGLSGRIFHLPLARAAGIDVISIAVSDSSKYCDAHPALEFTSADRLIANPAIDLIIVASPNTLHCEHACAALQGGKHVVIEKPIALNNAEVKAVIKAAEGGRGIASVFHSRRWDGDFLSLRHVVEQQMVGNWKVFESAWLMNKPVAQQRWKDQDSQGGGLLIDFMPHLLDQALHLFGLPDEATLDRSTQRAGSLGADFLSVTLRYQEKRARLMVDCFSPSPRQRFRLAGDGGEYTVTGIDNQEDHLRRDIDVFDEDFGAVDDMRISEFADYAGQRSAIAMKRGNYASFYRDLRIAIESGGKPPVSLHEAGRVVDIIDALNRNQVWARG
ncbi:Gfo/Idh/MocA family oxidoreductase [Agrobacterium vitis]